MAAASCPAGAVRVGFACPPGPEGMAPEGSSRRGLPRAGRTVSGAGAGPRPELSCGGAGAVCPSDCCWVLVVRCTLPVPEAAGVEGVTGMTGVTGVAGAAGGSPVICRSGIAGRRATVRGGAVRRGRTAAGRARCTEAEAEASVSEAVTSPESDPEPDLEPEAAPEADPEAEADPETTDRWTGAVRPGFRPPARPDADGSFAGAAPAVPPAAPASAPPSASGRAARSSSGPPGEAERATPGRATPWMRPTGADGRTAWPSSPPRVGFCQEASWDRNRSPSLTPIEDRATVTAGGAT